MVLLNFVFDQTQNMELNDCAVCFDEYRRGIGCVKCRRTICVNCFFKVTISCHGGCHVTYKCPFCRNEYFISEEKLCIILKNTTIKSPIFVNNESGNAIFKLTRKDDGSVVIETSTHLFCKA